MKTVKDYNLHLNSLKHKQQHEKISTVLFYQVYADTVKAKHSTAEYGRRLCLFAHQTSWSSDLESGVRVTCDVGYPCANFSLLKPLCYRVRSDVCDRQTDVRQKHRLMHPPYGGGGTTMAAAASVALVDDTYTALFAVAPCPSVTFVYCIQTAEDIVKLLSRSL